MNNLGVLGEDFIAVFKDQLTEDQINRITTDSIEYERQQQLRASMQRQLKTLLSESSLVDLHNKACGITVPSNYYIHELNSNSIDDYFSRTLAEKEQAIDAGEVNPNDLYFVTTSCDGFNNGLFTFSSVVNENRFVDLGRLVDYINVMSLHGSYGLSQYISEVTLSSELFSLAVAIKLSETIRSKQASNIRVIKSFVMQQELLEEDVDLTNPEYLEAEPVFDYVAVLSVRLKELSPLIKKYILSLELDDKKPDDSTFWFVLRFEDISLLEDSVKLKTPDYSLSGWGISWNGEDGINTKVPTSFEVSILAEAASRIRQDINEEDIAWLFNFLPKSIKAK